MTITFPEQTHTAQWMFKQGEAPVLTGFETECEHINTEYQEVATGLSPLYDPLTTEAEVCLDCGEVL